MGSYTKDLYKRAHARFRELTDDTDFALTREELDNIFETHMRRYYEMCQWLASLHISPEAATISTVMAQESLLESSHVPVLFLSESQLKIVELPSEEAYFQKDSPGIYSFAIIQLPSKVPPPYGGLSVVLAGDDTEVELSILLQQEGESLITVLWGDVALSKIYPPESKSVLN